MSHYGAVESDGLLETHAHEQKKVAGPVETHVQRKTQNLRNIAAGTLLFLGCVLLAFLVTSLYMPQRGGPGRMGRLDATSQTFMYSSLSEEEQTTLFADFISHFGKTYTTDSDEYATRFSYFKTTLSVIDERNAAEQAAMGEGVHGITKFADLSQEEFESTYLLERYEEEDEYSGTDRRKRRGLNALLVQKKKDEALKIKSSMFRRVLQEIVSSDVSASATLVDWSASGITTPVNDQGTGCRGASWAFTAIEQIESDAIRKGYLTTADTLSVQQLLDCNTGSTGCESGSLESAYDYSSKINGGLLHWASQYPYAASSSECASADSGYAATLGSYATVTKYHNEEYGYTTTQVESNMLAHLVATGPLSACLDASTWNTYVSGTLTACEGTTINQCVQIVGVYYDPVSDTGYYKLRNSWGTDFGEDGYIRLAHGVNACDVVYNPGYTDPAESLSRRR